MWEALYVIGLVILVAGFAWGIHQSRTKNRTNVKITEAATKESYTHPDRYADSTQQQLQDQVRPEPKI